MIATIKTCRCGNVVTSKHHQTKCNKCLAAYKKEMYVKQKLKDPEFFKRRDRKYHLKHQCGITLEEYEAMAEQQFHRCAICGDYETRSNRGGILNLNVDHDHKTGKIRGLLCNRCNRVLGMVKDDQTVLTEMKNYLGDKNECNENKNN
ncbi:hypothetical protein LCGC14_2146860 [marine sediment metagenome]|uniref:Recombination endonuclease VII n=1 Tax=marine sediment metagenome TaxID=412755 RepID=A0A0F9EJ00_9ZZZZ